MVLDHTNVCTKYRIIFLFQNITSYLGTYLFLRNDENEDGEF